MSGSPVEYALLHHDQRLAMLEAHQSQTTGTVNALVDRANADGHTAQRVNQLEKQLKEAQGLLQVTFAAVLMVAVLSAISVGHLSSQFARGAAHAVSQSR